MKLIDKNALVAEIERKIKEYQSTGDDYWFPVIENLKVILSFLNTLEVKEVDLDKEYKDFVEEDTVYNQLVNGIVGKAIAKHFFELGLKARTDKELAKEVYSHIDSISILEI